MKFKDPKTGEVYEDIGAAVIAMCGRQGGCSSAKENTCPILRKTQWLNQSDSVKLSDIVGGET